MLQRAPLHLLWGGKRLFEGIPDRSAATVFNNPKHQNKDLKEDERNRPPPPPPIHERDPEQQQ